MTIKLRLVSSCALSFLLRIQATKTSNRTTERDEIILNVNAAFFDQNAVESQIISR
jgi:hypothetical protein